MENLETIAAISTPPGRGGVAVVRVSGPAAFAVATCLTGRPVDASLAGRFFHAVFKAKGLPLDDGMVLVFATPVYFMGVTAGLKTVMDRLSPYAAPEGKKYFNPKESYLIATATAANPEMFEAVCLEFDYLMGKLGIKHTNKLLVGGVAGEGDVLDREDAMEKAILSGYSVGKIGGVY